MTALVFWLQHDNVWIVTDTLALGTGGKPFKYVTKVFPLPHLSAALCGTGDMNIILEWFQMIHANVIASSFLYLNTVGAEQLPGVSRKYEHLKAGSTTIYHFGFDSDAKSFRGFALRSVNGFVAEELRHGVGVKPYGEELSQILAQDLGDAGVAAVIRVVEEQKRRDDALPAAERLGIGGELHLLLLTEERQFCWTCHRFSDYAALFKPMIEALKESNALQGPSSE